MLTKRSFNSRQLVFIASIILNIILCAVLFTQSDDVATFSVTYVDHIDISQEITHADYRNDIKRKGMWTRVSTQDDITNLYNAIRSVDFHMEEMYENGYAMPTGSCPRYVVFFLDDGTELRYRFLDDRYLWYSGTLYRYDLDTKLYDQIDDILQDYDYIPYDELMQTE